MIRSVPLASSHHPLPRCSSAGIMFSAPFLERRASQALLAAPSSLVAMFRSRTPTLPGAWPDRSQLSLVPPPSSQDGGELTDAEIDVHSDRVPSSFEQSSPTDDQDQRARTSDATMYYDANDTVTDVITEEILHSSNDRRPHAGNQSPLEAKEEKTPSKSAPVQNMAGARDSKVFSKPEFENVPDVWTAAVKQETTQLPPWLASEPHDGSPQSESSRLGEKSTRSTTSSDLADVSSTSDSYTESHPSSPITPIDYEMLKGTHSDRPQSTGASTLQGIKATSDNTKNHSPSPFVRFPSRPDPEALPHPSPSVAYMSPRPLPELPSLTTSLSTVTSSSLHSQGPSSRFTTACLSFLPVPDVPTSEGSIEEDPGQSLESECVMPSSYFDMTPGQVGSSTSPSGSPLIVLSFPEPHSPDSAHFSPPTTELISFASPASSQFQLSLPHSSSSDSLPSMRRHSTRTLQDSRPQPLAMDVSSVAAPPLEACRRPSTNFAGRRKPEPTLRSKRSFIGTVKKMGARVKHLFKPGSSSRPKLDSVVSPATPSYLIDLSFAPLQTASPPSRGQSEERDSLQLPTFTLTDAPTTPPRPSPFEGSPSSRPRSRRFSMPISLRVRSRQPSNLRPITPSPTHSTSHLPLTEASPASDRVRTESQVAVDRVMEDWAESGRNDNSRADAEDMVRGLGLDLARRSARISQRASVGNF